MVFEPLGGGFAVATDDHCRVQSDAVHLARFAAPTAVDIACDLGTGNAVIPLLWCRRTPPRHITAVEREGAFVDLARLSVAHNDLDRYIAVVQADWNDLAALPTAHSISLVTCNPPYFPFGGARQSAHPLARAARHEDRADCLDRLCQTAAHLLSSNGRFCLCHRPERLEAVMAALHSAGLAPRRLQFVQATPSSAPWLVLIEAGVGGLLHTCPTWIEQTPPPHTDVYKKVYG